MHSKNSKFLTSFVKQNVLSWSERLKFHHTRSNSKNMHPNANPKLPTPSPFQTNPSEMFNKRHILRTPLISKCDPTNTWETADPICSRRNSTGDSRLRHTMIYIFWWKTAPRFNYISASAQCDSSHYGISDVFTCKIVGNDSNLVQLK